MLGMTVPVQLTKMRNSAEAVASIAREKGSGTGSLAKGQGHGQQVDKDLATIMDELQRDYGDYKYTVYRCASKFVALQKIFHSGKIPYKLVLAILERHNLSGGLELMVPPFQLTSLLHDVYFACEKLGHFNQDLNYQLDRATGLLANFLWNVYDPQRRHSISLLEIKITFILLCKLYSSDHLVGDFFGLLADAKTQIISRYAFEQLLATLSKLLSYLGEGKAYGDHNLPLTMEQSFARCPHGVGGLTEQQFHKLWTGAGVQTRFLIYGNLLALVKRIEDTEHLIHSNSCAGCRKEHIVGIRFRCQVCRDVSLCLPCFAVGFAGGRHEPGHRMCEVFVEDQPPLRWTRHLAKLCGWLTIPRKTHEEERRGFCNAQESGAVLGQSAATPIPAETRSLRSSQCQEKEKEKEREHTVILQQQQELCSLTGLASKASSRLQSIIDRLLLQNAKLESQLQTVATASSSEISQFLSAHQSFLLQIIEDMRQLSHSSVAASPPPPPREAPRVAPPAAPLVSSTFLSSSTPQRQIFDMYAPVGANLTHSINGAELNRSYLEANKSDYSLNDISLWFDQRRSSVQPGPGSLPAPLALPMPLGALLDQQPPANGGDGRDTEMVNFKLLLHKVKEIVEDSYSDNAELSAATQNLENVLDSIIKSEEQQRRVST
ncbi:dystrophin [Drosophila elegans]|uniref:dystrophin n=1 Tax=Drosophila elegans TaxID=30023 RepID=UPI0007E6BD41|nr:dystrophin [Drosophila elegans]